MGPTERAPQAGVFDRRRALLCGVLGGLVFMTHSFGLERPKECTQLWSTGFGWPFAVLSRPAPQCAAARYRIEGRAVMVTYNVAITLLDAG